MAADPIEAMARAIDPTFGMREGIACDPSTAGLYDAEVLKKARAAWKLALDHLEGPSHEAWEADDEMIEHLAYARREILPG